MLELVASIAIFASFMTATVVAVQSSRAPQFAAVNRHELLETMVGLLNQEASSPQESLFTDGSFTPPHPCSEATNKTCIAVGSTTYEILWRVSQKPGLGPNVVSLTASATAADGILYSRSVLASAAHSTSESATLRVRLTGSPLDAGATYLPVEIYSDLAETGVVTALSVDPIEGYATGSFDHSLCSPSCFLNGTEILVASGTITEASFPTAEVSEVSASDDEGNSTLTVGQGYTEDWDPGISAPQILVFEGNLEVSAPSCSSSGPCPISASPTAEPGDYVLSYSGTEGAHGTVTVSVEENPTVIYAPATVSATPDSVVAVELLVRNGSGEPMAAELCLRPQSNPSCALTLMSDEQGFALAVIEPSESALWLVTVEESAAEAVFSVEIRENPTAITPIVEYSENLATVTIADLVAGTAVEVASSDPLDGVFGPAGPVLADSEGIATLYFELLPGSSLTGIEICLTGTENCGVLS